ncbi:MAG: two-component system response regulator CreB [Oceanococcus sp.]
MPQSRILIIEDESSIADNIVYALTSEGFAAHWCATAGEGLAAAQEDEYDLVVLDIGLPDGNGFDVCRDLRKTSQRPIIFLSARDSELDKVLGLELGADDYMVKPFSPRELVARVRARLRTASSATQHAQLQLDESANTAQLNGQPLSLTRYEFLLLAFLKRRPGQVFTRDQLLQGVWSDPGSAFDRTVDTHIKTLRQKLRAADASNAMIRTHRGVGYSLQLPASM